MTAPVARSTPSSAARLTARAHAVVEHTLASAARRGELGVASTRLLLCALLLARELVVNAADLARGQGKEVVVTALLVAGAALSIATLRTAPKLRLRAMQRLLLASALCDVVLVVGGIAAIVLQPEPGYAGLLSLPYVLVWPLVVVAAGLRLTRTVAAVAGVAHVVGLAALVAVDVARNGVAADGGWIAYALIVFASAALLAVVVADRALRLVVRGAEAAIEAARVRERLGAYVGRDVAEAALLEKDLVLGGTRQPVAVLFSDLRGFTSYAERTPPETLVDELNAYLEEITAAVASEGGVVDKYMGDGVMAVFGAPRPRDDDAARAVRAARRMHEALARHNQARAVRGLAPLAQGIGGHYGAAIAGHVGTLERAQYTIVGDVVNLAARLESATKDAGVPVLLSRALVDAARAAGDATPVRVHGTLPVRGREAHVDVFTLE